MLVCSANSFTVYCTFTENTLLPHWKRRW